MRIMLDTNILISMLLFPSVQFRKILDYITRNHKLVLSSFIIDELTAVVARKFPKKRYAIDSFLSDLSYELVYTPRHMPGNLFNIRDINDYPVLYTAIYWKHRYFYYGRQRFFGCRDWNARDYDARRVFRKGYKK